MHDDPRVPNSERDSMDIWHLGRYQCLTLNCHEKFYLPTKYYPRINFGNIPDCKKLSHPAIFYPSPRVQPFLKSRMAMGGGGGGGKG